MLLPFKPSTTRFLTVNVLLVVFTRKGRWLLSYQKEMDFSDLICDVFVSSSRYIFFRQKRENGCTRKSLLFLFLSLGFFTISLCNSSFFAARKRSSQILIIRDLFIISRTLWWWWWLETIDVQSTTLCFLWPQSGGHGRLNSRLYQ